MLPCASARHISTCWAIALNDNSFARFWTKCAGVPDRVLQPREAWADKSAYDQQATKLAAMFKAEERKYT